MRRINYLLILLLIPVGTIRSEEPQDSSIVAQLRQLREQLKDPNPEVRRQALKTMTEVAKFLEGFEADAAEVVERDTDVEVKIQAANYLEEWIVKRSRNLYPLARTLTDPDPDVRVAIVHAISAAHTVDRTYDNFRKEALEEKVVPALLWCLDEYEDAATLQRVINTLGLHGPLAEPAVPRLIEFLKSPDNSEDSLASWAATALGNIGPKAASAVPVILERMPKQSDRFVCAALHALSKIDPAHPEVVPTLVRYLKHPTNQGFRHCASGALTRVAAAGPEADPALVEALRKQAVPALLEVFRQTKENPPARQYSIRARSLSALGEIARCSEEAFEEVSPVLLKLLDDQEEPEWVRGYSFSALSNLPYDPKTTILAMVRYMEREVPNGTAIPGIAECFVQVGPKAVPYLLESFKRSGDRVRGDQIQRQILYIFQKLGPAARAAKPFLKERADSTTYMGRQILKVLPFIEGIP